MASYLYGSLHITYVVSVFRGSSAWVACLISSSIIHSRMSAHVSIALIFRFIPMISSPVPSVWLYLDNQSAILSYGSVLYRIYCNLGDKVVISFLNKATNGLWSVIMLTSWTKQWWWNVSRLRSMTDSSPSMLLYLVSVLVRLSACKCYGVNAVKLL